MSRVECFEDLIAWQKARCLTRAVYETTREGVFHKDRALAGQMQRAAVSVMSNIAEGFDRSSRPEFHHFLVMAKGSCGEIRSQLYIALDCGYIDQAKFDALMAQALEAARVIGGLRASLARKG